MLSTVTRLPLVVAVATLESGVPAAVVQSAAGTVGLTQTAVAAVVTFLRMEAVVLKSEMVKKLMS